MCTSTHLHPPTYACFGSSHVEREERVESRDSEGGRREGGEGGEREGKE